MVFALWFVNSLTVPRDAAQLSISCAQILYGFTMRPDTLPRWYNSWYVLQDNSCDARSRTHSRPLGSGLLAKSHLRVSTSTGSAPGVIVGQRITLPLVGNYDFYTVYSLASEQK